jgi:hypothetical protein
VLPNVAGGFLLQSVRAPAQVSALAAKKHLARNVINLGLPNYDRWHSSSLARNRDYSHKAPKFGLRVGDGEVVVGPLPTS